MRHPDHWPWQKLRQVHASIHPVLHATASSHATHACARGSALELLHLLHLHTHTLKKKQDDLFAYRRKITTPRATYIQTAEQKKTHLQRRGVDVPREDDVPVPPRGLGDRQRHPGVSMSGPLGPPRCAGVHQRAVRYSDLRQQLSSMFSGQHTRGKWGKSQWCYTPGNQVGTVPASG